MIKLERLCLQMPGFSLQDITLDILDREYFVLVGPYASGKTLLLETISGLRKATSGRIWIDGRDVTSLESERRNIGMVYQDCALFPHLTVAENIAFGLKVRRRPAAEISSELDRVAHLFGIGGLLARRPQHLSGGEKQKVALARALVTNPSVLLLDEPLGALDPQAREKVREEIMQLHGELGTTIIHVTHDFEEAVAMGTRIAVICAGSIKQVGTPDEVFRRPGSEFVARFTMSVNVFPGVAEVDDSGTAVFTTGGIRLITETGIAGDCLAAIRPENIRFQVRARRCGGRQRLPPGSITRIVNKGSIVDVVVDCCRPSPA